MTSLNDIVERQAAILADLNNLDISELETLANSAGRSYPASEQDRAQKLLARVSENALRCREWEVARIHRDPRDNSDFASVMDLLRDISPGPDMCVDDRAAHEIRAKSPDVGDPIISVAEVRRHKLMLLGCKIVCVDKLLDLVHDFDGEVIQVGRVPGMIVELPDGSRLEVKSGHDLAVLRAKLEAASTQVTEDGNEMH